MANWSDAAATVRQAEESWERKYGPRVAARLRRGVEIYCPLCGAKPGMECDGPAPGVELHKERIDTGSVLAFDANERAEMLRGRS